MKGGVEGRLLSMGSRGARCGEVVGSVRVKNRAGRVVSVGLAT